MPLLQRIIEHFQNLVLVSDVSLIIMGVSIIIMSLAYAYSIIVKNNKYESIIVKIGILVRILMIIGFTIEFSHQKAIYQGNSIMDRKYEAMDQFANYLFYGYIFVIGLYDIFTIGINKFRGFFHTFDLTIISMPILYGITYLILNFQFNNDILMGVIILASLLVLPYLFFNLYWKQNVKWYSIFMGYTITLLIAYKIVRMEILFSSTLISYFLIGCYEFSRHLFNKAREAAAPNLWKKLKYTSIILPVILMFSSIITLNTLPIEIEKRYYVESFYKEDATFTSMEEAENLARIALEDQTSNIAHWQGTSEDFNNRYMFSLGDYSVSIDGATGKIFEIRCQKDKKINPKESLSQEEIEIKTLKWLQSVGFTFNEKRHHLKTEQQLDKYSITIYNKYTDGSLDDKTLGQIRWYLDGKLYAAGVGLLFSDYKDYKDIKTNELEIEDNMKAWYNKLGEEMPPYIIDNLTYWFGDMNPEFYVRCKNNDRFSIDCYTGEILTFHRDYTDGNGNKPRYSEEAYNKYKDKAEMLAKDLSSNLKVVDYKLQENTYKESLHYSFVEKLDMLNNSINIELDLEGNLKSFGQWSDYKIRFYSDKKFKISSSAALKLVTKEYKPLGIYTKRVKLAVEVKDNGEVNYKWMVVVIPFKNVEHQIYYVDADTGKITPLLNYKK